MTLTKIAGLSILVTVFFQNTQIRGETFLSAEIGKLGGLKTSDKRINNFRVPVEMPYDPNFWPARGRRSRRDPEKSNLNDDCVALGGNLMLYKYGFRCPEIPKIHGEELANGKSGPLDLELMPPTNLDNELLSGSEKTKSGCPESKGKLGVRIPALLETNLQMSPKLFNDLRLKKQRPYILYGKEVYWVPENIHGEKKKKEDVFWVSRGKKNSSQK